MHQSHIDSYMLWKHNMTQLKEQTMKRWIFNQKFSNSASHFKVFLAHLAKYFCSYCSTTAITSTKLFARIAILGQYDF